MEKRKISKFAVLSFAILCICYFVPNYAQYQVSPLGSQVMEQYAMDNAQLSSLFSAPMIPAIFFSLIGGILIDRFGPKFIIGAGMLIGTVGCILRVFVGTFSPLMAATALTGFSACFINAGGGKIIGGLYGPEQVSAKMGILMASSTAGMTVAMFTSARLPSIQTAFTIAAVLAVAAVVLWFLLFKTPRAVQQYTQAPAGPSLGECLKVAVRSPGVWLVAFSLFCIMAANVVFSSYVPTALGQKEIDAVTAGNLGAFMTIGNFLGCFAAPSVIKALKSQKKTLLLFAVLAAVGVAFAWRVSSTVLLAVLLLLTGVFLGGMIPTLLALPVQFAAIGPVYAGTAGGVVGTIQLLGAVLIPTYVLAPIAGNNFSLLFVLGGVCLLLAGVLSACLKEIH